VGGAHETFCITLLKEVENGHRWAAGEGRGKKAKGGRLSGGRRMRGIRRDSRIGENEKKEEKPWTKGNIPELGSAVRGGGEGVSLRNE